MMVQENVYKMAIMTLSSKLYLQWTTFFSIKKPPASQLPFLGNCHGDEKEGLGGGGGQGRTTGCCFLAEILLSIHQGHKQAAHRCAPKFLWLLLPSSRQVYFPSSPRCVAERGFIPMGPRCSQTLLGDSQAHLPSRNNPDLSQHLNHVAFCTPSAMMTLWERGGESTKKHILF